jgi:hypothetical protein
MITSSIYQLKSFILVRRAASFSKKNLYVDNELVEDRSGAGFLRRYYNLTVDICLVPKFVEKISIWFRCYGTLQQQFFIKDFIKQMDHLVVCNSQRTLFNLLLIVEKIYMKFWFICDMQDISLQVPPSLGYLIEALTTSPLEAKATDV